EATGRLLELTIDGESEARFTYYPDDSPWAGLVAERITPTGPDLYTVVRYTYDAERRLDAESVEIRKRADDAPYTTKRSFAWIRDARDRPQRVADGFPFFDDYSSSRSRPTFTYDQGTVTELRSRSVEQDWCRVTYDSATVREGQAWAIYRVQQIPYGSLAAFEGAPGYGTAGSRGLFEDSLLASTCGFDVFTEVVRDDDGRWVSGTTGLSDGRVLDIAYAFDCWPDDATLPPLPEPPPNVDVGPTTRAYPGPCTVRHVGDLGITTSLTRFAYDADGRATKAVIRGNEEVVTRFMGYDDAGRLVSVLNDTPLEEGLGTPSTVTYDDDGLITEVSAVYCGDSVVRVEVADGRYASHEPFLSGASRGYVERYAYDAAGERVVRVWRTATADGSIQEDTSYTYVSSGPAAGKLARIERRAPAALTFNANVDFTYDTATGALAQTTFVQVDLAGSPLAQPIVSSWSVTGDGEVTARVGGEATIYAQDGGRLAAIDPETGCETVYEGRLVEKQTQLVVTIGEPPCLSPSFQRPYADYVVEGVRVAHVCADGPTYERTTDGFGNVLTEVDADGTTIYGYTCWEE
ncbi:MAG: hypothetical protein KC635_20760, partial [Myxococcales bacterium]|nr:hypothetical protein [Myxococcales bacterium]